MSGSDVPVTRFGLFDGFEAYRTPSEEAFQAALVDGLVVPDTNVLLNLYRYTTTARDSLLQVLARVGDRLWVPQQVVVEFWGAREAVLRDPRATAETRNRLGELRGQALQTLRTWANRVSLEDADSRRSATFWTVSSPRSSMRSPCSTTAAPMSMPGTRPPIPS